MDRIRVAVIFGGCSEEHDISVKSAVEIAAHIDSEKYEPVYIGITKTGAWRLCEKPCPLESQTRSVILSPDKETRGLLTVKDNGFLPIDVIFPVIHGKSGEDGQLQGLFELSGIPYVGCDVQSSAVCMDKSLAYILAANAGIAVPKFKVVGKDADLNTVSIDAYPVFVKPARSGSSFGVRKVTDPEELPAAIEEAGRYDDKILIEQAVSGCEVGCAVMGERSLTVGEVDQITLSRGIFRIHQEDAPEQGSENAVITVPADLPQGERNRIRETAATIYKTLGCRGLARVDMFLRQDGLIVLNEVNTLPGFTSYSRYPRMMAAAGITLTELLDRLITSALNRGLEKFEK